MSVIYDFAFNEKIEKNDKIALAKKEWNEIQIHLETKNLNDFRIINVDYGNKNYNLCMHFMAVSKTRNFVYRNWYPEDKWMNIYYLQ